MSLERSLRQGSSIGKTFELLAGETEIERAIAALSNA